MHTINISNDQTLILDIIGRRRRKVFFCSALQYALRMVCCESELLPWLRLSQCVMALRLSQCVMALSCLCDRFVVIVVLLLCTLLLIILA